MDGCLGPGGTSEILSYLWFAAHGTHLEGEGRRGEERGGRGKGNEVVGCGLKPPGFTRTTSGA